MKTHIYLSVSSSGSVRSTKNGTTLNPNEVQIYLTLELPDILFRKPQLNANIIVPASAAAPVNIPVDVANNIKESIEGITQMDVNITVINPEPKTT